MSKSKSVFAVLAIAMATALPIQGAQAEAGIAGFNSGCKAEIRKWKKQGGWKAFAVSNVYLVKTTEWQSCGSSAKYSTKSNATTVALSVCRAELKKQHAPKSAYCSIKLVSG